MVFTGTRPEFGRVIWHKGCYMSIDTHYNATIYVQTNTPTWDGTASWADRSGSNRGYVRVLSSRERASVDKPTLFSTHRAAMTCAVVPLYGERLRVVPDSGTAPEYYDVKLVNPSRLSGGAVQLVDCEVVQ